jgi:hypothetical protein
MANQNDNRVLVRHGARILSGEEISSITGGFHLPTNSVCTFDARASVPVPEDAPENSC